VNESITQEDLNRFYKGNGIKAACYECGTNAWNVEGASASSVPSLMILNEVRAFGATNLPLLVLSCKMCGHIKSFARLTVEAWIKANHNE
jgi:hypothetical protein